MTITFDPSTDFEDITDGLEAVTIRIPTLEKADDERLTNGRFDKNLTSWTATGFAWEERLAKGGSLATLIQSITTVVGDVYQVEFDLFANWSATEPKVKIGTSSGGSQIATVQPGECGRFAETFTATATTTWLTLLAGDLTARFGNVSVRKIESASITHALRRAVSTREVAASGGVYRAGDTKWHLPDAEVSTSAPPRVGGLLIDGDDNEWSILAVDEHTLGNRWRCWCRKNTIADLGTDSQITIKKQVYVKDEGGAAAADLTTWARSVRAKIQVEDTTPETLHHLRLTPRKATIFVQHYMPIDHRFVAVANDGRTYKLLGYRQPERIDGLFQIDASDDPWPMN